MKYYTWSIIAIVAVAIVGGFFVVGSPTSKRAERFDERRTQDLNVIQNEIVFYWQQKNALPVQLSVLNNPIRGFILPTDPETNKAYGYTVESSSTFKLCADFTSPTPKDNASSPTPSYYAADANWQHGAGNFCFDRSIDKDIMKPLAPYK